MEEGKTMTESNTVIYDPRCQMRADKMQLSEVEITRLMELVSRVLAAKKPAKEDLKEIRGFLVDCLEFCKAIFSIADAVQTEIIKHTMGDQKVTRIAMEEYILTLRNEMGYNAAPIMENLLIENIVTAWLSVQHCESQLAFRL